MRKLLLALGLLLAAPAFADENVILITPNGDFAMDETNDAARTNLVTPLPAGTNNIGDVDVLTLPPLVAGTANIGDVDVLTLPALPAGANEIGRVRLTDGTDTATVLNLAGEDPLAVAIVDGSGAQLTSFGGTEYQEDSAHVSGDQLQMMGVVQRSTDGGISTDGDRSLLQVDSNGYLKVNIKAGAGSGGNSFTDDAVFGIATDVGTPALGLADDVSPDAVNEGDAGVLRMTPERILRTALSDDSGNSVAIANNGGQSVTGRMFGVKSFPGGLTTGDSITALNDSLDVVVQSAAWGSVIVQVTGTWTATLSFEISLDNATYVAVEALPAEGGTSVTSTTTNGVWVVPLIGAGEFRLRASAFTSGTAVVTATFSPHVRSLLAGGSGGGTQYAEDTAHASGDTATMAGVVQQAADTALSTDGDRSLLQVDANGFLKVNIKAGAGSGGTAAADDSAFTVATTQVTVAGCIEATDTMDAGDLGGIKCGSDRELDVDLVSSIPAGTNNIGDIDVLTLPALPAGTNNIGDVDVLSFPDNEPFNVAQINGVTPLMGNGVTGTGSLRVTVASDNTAFTVNAAQSGTWNINNISGTVSLPTGAATSANQSTEITALQLIDDIVEVDDSAFTTAAGSIVVAGCMEATDVIDAGDVGAVKCGTDRELDIDVISLPAIPAGTNNIGDVDVLTLPSVTIGTFPDNEPFNVAQINGVTPLMGNGVTGTGSLRVTIASDNTAFSVNATASQATAANLNAEVQGDVAHDAAIAGNPVVAGAVTETPDDSAPANQVSAEAEAVRLVATRDGQQYVAPFGPRMWETSAEYTSAQTDTSLKAAPGAGLSFYITDITVTCNAAVTVSLEEDDTTDDLIDRMYCSGQGGGHERHMITPHKMTANQALLLTTSAAVTVFVAVSGYTAP